MGFYMIVFTCLAWLLGSAWADLTSSQVCFYACQQTFTNITFSTYIKTDDYYTGYCKDDLKLLSTFLCAKIHCTPYQITSGLAFTNDICTTYTTVDIPSYDVLNANVSHVSLESVPVLEMGPFNDTLIVDTLLLPSANLFDDSFKLWVNLSSQVIHVRVQLRRRRKSCNTKTS